MAAHAAKMVGVSEDSSSSDDEALRRCQEAVWDTQLTKKKDADSNVQQSKRIVVAEHEHDGNELQVTQGFRTHVAKKLGHFLDSCISESQTETSSCAESGKCDDGDDEGFRLFSTSIPGQTVEEPPPPVRRRPIPSSSDSDSEMESRLREAAVSVKDLLPSLPSPPSAEPPCSEKKKKKKKVAQEEEEEEESNVVVKKKKKKVIEGGEDSHVAKKKKKRKPNEEESEEVDFAGSPPNAQSNGDHENSQEHNQAKVKRKKKKRREGSTEEETLS
ncbi:protein CUSTOS [Scomber japonicus]|uniref:protein CUSTOS n=1 Tax=Scomber japonicus TaxID=13676 RepID=UPI0023059260|nr:protein CUSTOS [Scomber japonicus]